jgi:hypothetical protein
LVLVHNSRIKRELNRKTKPRYIGPCKVIKKTLGGSYALKELDGTPLARGIPVFCPLPYRLRGDLKLDAGPSGEDGELNDKEDLPLATNSEGDMHLDNKEEPSDLSKR